MVIAFGAQASDAREAFLVCPAGLWLCKALVAWIMLCLAPAQCPLAAFSACPVLNRSTFVCIFRPPNGCWF